VRAFDLWAVWGSSGILWGVVMWGGRRWMGWGLMGLYVGFIVMEFVFFRD
jgi:hypothetical protein